MFNINYTVYCLYSNVSSFDNFGTTGNTFHLFHSWLSSYELVSEIRNRLVRNQVIFSYTENIGNRYMSKFADHADGYEKFFEFLIKKFNYFYYLRHSRMGGELLQRSHRGYIAEPMQHIFLRFNNKRFSREFIFGRPGAARMPFRGLTELDNLNFLLFKNSDTIKNLFRSSKPLVQYHISELFVSLSPHKVKMLKLNQLVMLKFWLAVEKIFLDASTNNNTIISNIALIRNMDSSINAAPYMVSSIRNKVLELMFLYPDNYGLFFIRLYDRIFKEVLESVSFKPVDMSKHYHYGTAFDIATTVSAVEGFDPLIGLTRRSLESKVPLPLFDKNLGLYIDQHFQNGMPAGSGITPAVATHPFHSIYTKSYFQPFNHFFYKNSGYYIDSNKAIPLLKITSAFKASNYVTTLKSLSSDYTNLLLDRVVHLQWRADPYNYFGYHSVWFDFWCFKKMRHLAGSFFYHRHMDGDYVTFNPYGFIGGEKKFLALEHTNRLLFDRATYVHMSSFHPIYKYNVENLKTTVSLVTRLVDKWKGPLRKIPFEYLHFAYNEINMVNLGHSRDIYWSGYMKRYPSILWTHPQVFGHPDYLEGKRPAIDSLGPIRRSRPNILKYSWDGYKWVAYYTVSGANPRFNYAGNSPTPYGSPSLYAYGRPLYVD